MTQFYRYTMSNGITLSTSLACIVAETVDFADLKTNTSGQLFEITMTTNTYETRSGLMHRLSTRYQGLSGCNCICCSYIRPHIYELMTHFLNNSIWSNEGSVLNYNILTSVKEENEVKEELKVQGKHCLPKVRLVCAASRNEEPATY